MIIRWKHASTQATASDNTPPVTKYCIQENLDNRLIRCPPHGNEKIHEEIHKKIHEEVLNEFYKEIRKENC